MVQFEILLIEGIGVDLRHGRNVANASLAHEGVCQLDLL